MSDIKIPRTTFLTLVNLLCRITMERDSAYGSQLTDEDYELALSLFKTLEGKLDKIVARDTYRKRNQK